MSSKTRINNAFNESLKMEVGDENFGRHKLDGLNTTGFLPHRT